jgi:hypothetical protein
MYLEEKKGHSLNSHDSIGLQPWLNYKPWSYNAGTDQPCNVRMAGTEDAVLHKILEASLMESQGSLYATHDTPEHTLQRRTTFLLLFTEPRYAP